MGKFKFKKIIKSRAYMSNSLFWVGISIMGSLLTVSSELRTQAANLEIFSSHSSAISPVLVAQSYGTPRTPAEATRIVHKFEAIADSAYKSGSKAFNNRQYNQAFNLYAQAADNYWLCKGVKFISREDDARVTRKYNQAVGMRTKAHQRRG
jgi:hypothetical protein